VVLAAVLGATFALGGGIAVEVWRVRRDDRRKVTLLKGLLQQEIPIIMNAVSSIISTFEEKRFYPRAGVQLIHSSLRSFDRNREWVALIKDGGLRQDIFQYYARVSILCYGLEEWAPDGVAPEGDEGMEGIRDFVEVSGPITENGESLIKRLGAL
jgi:hypothetical protein